MKKLRVCETFVSIQGEGVDVGSPAFFIRTGRCSLRCRFCDTAYAWDSGDTVSVSELAERVFGSKLPEVVITGGEPLEEEHLPHLISALAGGVRKVTVETCGYIYRKDLPKTDRLRLVVSPKTPTMGVDFPSETVRKLLENYRCYLKFCVFSQEDLEVVKDFVKRNVNLVPEPVVVQPLQVPEEAYPETAKRVAMMVISDLELLNTVSVRVIPQVHKLVGLK
jgi:7-carboxy-7-deazaguanine synthase